MGSERLVYDTELEVVEQGVEPRSVMTAEATRLPLHKGVCTGKDIEL